MVVPAYTSAPAVFLGLFAHRNAAATQWSAPVAPGGGSAERECNPLMITVCFTNGSSGFLLTGDPLLGAVGYFHVNLKRGAFDDPHHDGRELVLARSRITHDGPHH